LCCFLAQVLPSLAFNFSIVAVGFLLPISEVGCSFALILPLDTDASIVTSYAARLVYRVQSEVHLILLTTAHSPYSGSSRFLQVGCAGPPPIPASCRITG